MRPGDNEGSGAPDTPPFEGIIGPKRPGTRSPMHAGPRRIRATVALITGSGRRATREALLGHPGQTYAENPWRDKTRRLDRRTDATALRN